VVRAAARKPEPGPVVVARRATADSAFNIFTLGALFCAALAVVLLLVALVALFFRPTRAFGLGYLTGLVAGPVLGMIYLAAPMLAG
jgi:hypothetical protein